MQITGVKYSGRKIRGKCVRKDKELLSLEPE